MATNPAARGLDDDAALLDGLVISHDTIVEGVHYRADDPPASVGWKLAAVNASDLGAKGAEPVAAMLSLTISGDGSWEAAFLDGLEKALAEFGLSLMGGDTAALPVGAPRVLGMTVIGRAGAAMPSRGGGKPGDTLWVVGTIGDAAAGLAALAADGNTRGPLVDAYRTPRPPCAAGRAMAPWASASMDVSDGLLLDAARLGEASGACVEIELAAVPLSEGFIVARGDGEEARRFAATGGDDYALLFASSAAEADLRQSLPAGAHLTVVGQLVPGEGLILTYRGERTANPEHLGYEHRSP